MHSYVSLVVLEAFRLVKRSFFLSTNPPEEFVFQLLSTARLKNGWSPSRLPLWQSTSPCQLVTGFHQCLKNFVNIFAEPSLDLEYQCCHVCNLHVSMSHRQPIILKHFLESLYKLHPFLAQGTYYKNPYCGELACSSYAVSSEY